MGLWVTILEVGLHNMRATITGRDTSIIDGVLYFEDCSQCKVTDAVFPEIIGDGYTKTIRLVSLESNWFENVWIDGVGRQSEDIDFEMTLRREIRSGSGHWYAYRRVFGKLYKRYVGSDEKVTQEKLIQVARAMPTKKLGARKQK